MSVLKVNQIQTANGVIMANLNSSGANIGFQLASTLAPAFSAYASTTAGVTSSTWTKAAIDTKRFDTNNNFNTSTNRFTPTVAGYYQVNGDIYMYPTSGVASVAAIAIYKNGSQVNQNYSRFTTYGYNEITMPIPSVIYLNGTTDYIELYGYITAPVLVYFYGYAGTFTNFSAALIRSA